MTLIEWFWVTRYTAIISASVVFGYWLALQIHACQ